MLINVNIWDKIFKSGVKIYDFNIVFIKKCLFALKI